MLHALLHRKIGLEAPEAQRLEDAITSTVFGTLALVERWDVIGRWLGVPAKGSGSTNDIWFWPVLRVRGRTAIPDVCVRLQDQLIVIEAKYRSGRSDLPRIEESPEQVFDQLVGQYACITAAAGDRIGYPEGLQAALDECETRQIYLVDAARVRRARAELRQSLQREPRMKISSRPATWQALDRHLSELEPQRWVRDLRRFLAIAELSSFVGFGCIRNRRSTSLLKWGAMPRGRRIAIVEAVSAVPGTLVREIVRWGLVRPSSVRGRWQLSRRVAAPSAVLRWRAW